MTSPAPPPIDPQALRIVLFGLPDAGKSSLLGALGRPRKPKSAACKAGSAIRDWG